MLEYIKMCNQSQHQKVINYNDSFYITEFVKSPFICCYIHIDNNKVNHDIDSFDNNNITIFNPITLKPLKPNNNNTTGYYRYNIPKGCGFMGLQQIYLHQIVGIWKFGDFFMYRKDYQIDHIDNNKTNNNPANIQILLRSDNAKKRILKDIEYNNKPNNIKAFLPNTYDNIFIDDNYNLYKKLKDTYQLLHPRNEDKKIYVLKNKITGNLSNITLNTNDKDINNDIDNND